jgi:hypothetical protein
MEDKIVEAILAVGFVLAVLIYRGFKDVSEYLHLILKHQKYGE